MRPKILAPAGNFISLKAAIDAGCDEVYFGVQELNMRANAKNFRLRDLRKIAKTCHDNKVRAFLTVNTIVYESELNKVDRIIKAAKQAGIDAIIAWDMSVIKICTKYNLETHLSTQASVSNSQALLFYNKNIKNLKRVILARECSLDDIRKIIKVASKHKIEVETFIHGAMCVSVSGRCFMSQEIFGRSANRGDCLQPCRRNYEVLLRDPEEGHELQLGEDYVMSPKDLCSMPFIEQLIAANISAFKIEGRNRSPEYVKVVVSAYKEIIDYYYKNRAKIIRSPAERAKFEKLKSKLVGRMKKVYNRDFSSGFFLGKPVDEWCKAYGSKARESKKYIGKIINYYAKIGVAEVKLESGDLNVGARIMFQGPTTGVIEQELREMRSKDKSVVKAKKGSSVGIKTNGKVRKNDQVYELKYK